MDTLTTTFDAIARLAATADREALATLDAKRITLSAAARAAIDIGSIDDAALVATGSAERTATEAIDRRSDALVLAQAALIAAVPEGGRCRAALRTLPTPGDVVSLLGVIDGQVPYLIRDHGTPLHLLADGVRMGGVEAHDVSIADATLTIGSLGAWPHARIAAISVEEHDAMAVLLDDGTLLEIIEDPDFVWVDPAARAA